MKYILYDNEQTIKELVYCNMNGNETTEDVAKAITTEYYVGRFKANEHTHLGRAIKNDSDTFILRDLDGKTNIWQVCEKVADITDAIVPGLYYARKVGILVE